MTNGERTVSRPGLGELFRSAGVRVLHGLARSDVAIAGVTDDSRGVAPGVCFVAVRGIAHDGHEFLRAAVNAGAAAVVVDQSAWDQVHPSRYAGVAAVCVQDSREALAKLAAAWYGLRGAGDAASMRLVGITGTNGKTTTAWLLRSILRAAGRRVALLGTIEYDLISARLPAPMTTPAPVALCRHLKTAADAGADDAVLEVSSHALAQRRCDGLEFSVGVFTNLSGDHLDYHRDVDAYAAAKRRLFDGLSAGATAVVNLDDPNGTQMVSGCNARSLTYAVDDAALDAAAHGHATGAANRWAPRAARAGVRARMVEVGPHGTRFVLRGAAYETPVRCRLVGLHNVYNALAAAAAAEAMGIDAGAIRAGIEQLRGVPGRLQRVEPDGHPFRVVVDYAHTDDALDNVLRVLRPVTTRRLLCVFGCGGDRDRSKRPRMAAAVERAADVAYVTSDNPRGEDPTAIIDDVLTGFPARSKCRIAVEVDRRAAIDAAIAEARPGDTVLIAGKGHETYQLLGDDVLDFDDVAAARRALDAARGTVPGGADGDQHGGACGDVGGDERGDAPGEAAPARSCVETGGVV
ncbi:MAG: UDP-N-acetylmuramoyl-L-alanyl-D-glutamate--2,6-diaminopimelate ligase [Phycisphaerae bacterium]